MSTGVKLPSDPQERKRIPIYSGVLKYFPDAIAEVAKVSWAGNEQHNPGEPLHWARHKSTDQEDTVVRHLMEAGTIDSDGMRHTAKAAWRILAMLQLEIEAAREAEAKLRSNITGGITGTLNQQLKASIIAVNSPQIVNGHTYHYEGGTVAASKK